jgi:hypothetical protein
MPAALFELLNDANGMGERGGIIRQECAELIASHVVWPSDREKVARHQRPPYAVVMWDNEGIGARAVWIVRIFPEPEMGALKPNLSSCVQFLRPRFERDAGSL